MLDVVVLTDERYIDPKERNPYISNVLMEDQLVLDELERRGIKTKKLAWSDATFDWSDTRYALFRTTWDYAERFPEFSDWLMEASLKTKLLNDYDTIVWNLDKHYLSDLADKGVHVVETMFLEPKDSRTLKELHSETGWTHTVLKPSISAAAKDTYELTSATFPDHEKRFAELIENESMMLQPFQEDVIKRGELSLIVIGGRYTHAVLKVAKKGDFRVQDDFGGSVADYEPTEQEIDLALRAVQACDPTPLYARVDIVIDNEGKPAVSELELIEPELWFRRNTIAAAMLAAEVERVLQKS